MKQDVGVVACSDFAQSDFSKEVTLGFRLNETLSSEIHKRKNLTKARNHQ